MKKVIEKASRYLKILQDHNVEEFEIESDNMRFRFSTERGAVQVPPAVAPAAALADTEVQAGGSAAAAAASDELDMDEYATIASPIVGTFYRRPAPDKPPYVEVGTVVDPDQPVCIVEAMKLMNEIKSNIKGKVVKILIEDAQPVQAGQVLFLIDPV